MKLNFEKVKNYNQLLLAAAGTIALLFLIISGVFILVEMAGRFGGDDYQPGIIATDQTDRLLQDSLRKQIISFDQIEILDSADQIFLLPVSQADLAKPEHANDLIGLSNSYSDMKESPNRGYGVNYNNLVLHYGNSDSAVLVFDFRVCIDAYFYEKTAFGKYLVVTGSTKDTNGDKYLDGNDIRSIYIFNLETRSLSKIQTPDNLTAMGVYPVFKSNTPIGRFGLDRDKNGVFDWSTEPVFYYKIDLKNKKLTGMVSPDQLQKLQRLLEGR